MQRRINGYIAGGNHACGCERAGPKESMSAFRVRMRTRQCLRQLSFGNSRPCTTGVKRKGTGLPNGTPAMAMICGKKLFFCGRPLCRGACASTCIASIVTTSASVWWRLLGLCGHTTDMLGSGNLLNSSASPSNASARHPSNSAHSTQSFCMHSEQSGTSSRASRAVNWTH